MMPSSVAKSDQSFKIENARSLELERLHTS